MEKGEGRKGEGGEILGEGMEGLEGKCGNVDLFIYNINCSIYICLFMRYLIKLD